MNQIELFKQEVCAPKYLEAGESFKEGMSRIADALKDNEEHYQLFREILLEQRFLPGGRIQSSVGAARRTTAFNCYASETIDDSGEGIFKSLSNAFQTMRLGGGDGFDFSPLRPKGALIKSLGSTSSGPLSFMEIWDAMCTTVKSAGHRRGAMMGTMRIDHPDVEEFITYKQNGKLSNFNLSVTVTDKFMEALENDDDFDLVFEGVVYKTVRAKYLWNKIMRNTWDFAEPGVLFIDRINRKNNLNYCETIATTNPCLHPDSLVETVHGRVRIADIKESTMVYTRLEDGSLGVKPATASWISKKGASVTRIKTANGKSIKVTPNHKILVRSTKKLVWKEAKDLELGEVLVQLCRARRGIGYSGVKLTTEHNRAYRMEHRMVADAVYGIGDYHDVHHIDGDTYNNSIDNLQVLSHFEHSRYTATFDNPQSHQEFGEDGKFVSTGISPKTIIPMPEELRSNMKNGYSSRIVSIEENYEVSDVYDLTVEDTHNFIANFMVVHNCGEQPLPPHGACLLGSINLTKYVHLNDIEDILDGLIEDVYFDYVQLKKDIPHIVRSMDNVIDKTVFPLPEQEFEAKYKRRMGIGVTGVANAGSFMGHEYGSKEFNKWLTKVMRTIMNECYKASINLAKEKGSFPAFDKDGYLKSRFIQEMLSKKIQMDIHKYGIRNSHLLSVAPTGTISLWAGNISSGIEPVYQHSYTRKAVMEDGTIKEYELEDYAFSEWGLKGKTSDEVTAKEHIDVLCLASKFVDSACSKTCNVGEQVTFHDFKDLYLRAYKGGSSGCTTFRPAGLLKGILSKKEEEGAQCVFDIETGEKSCAD